MNSKAPKALVIHPVFKVKKVNDTSIDPSMEEAVALARSLNLFVVYRKKINISKPQAGYFFGKGAVERIYNAVDELNADLVIINGVISPIQQRNLEKTWNVKIIDRTHLILEIFADRATTKEGKLQVELATLSYQRTRLVRSWTHLERQRGALGFVGGPGETQIESDRRVIDKSINRIRKQLKKVVKTRFLHRKSRKKVPYPIIALVGYTNAGKSTLFNLITNSNVYAKDMLFATLDPTMRSLELSSKNNVIISDTVGFISNLPTELIAAFRATLEEVLGADLIIHVRDIAHEDTEQQKVEVERILSELGLDKAKLENNIEVVNKIDLLSSEQLKTIQNIADRSENVFLTSSKSELGIKELVSGINNILCRDFVLDTVRLGFDRPDVRARLYDSSIIESEKLNEDGYEISVRWSEQKRGEFFNLLNSEKI